MPKYIFLGIVQGLTEFLPVSSSGHLVILQKVLGLSGHELEFTVILHLATALAMFIFFLRDIIELWCRPKLIRDILIVTLITGIIAFCFKDFFAGLFSSVKTVTISLLITGIILIFTKKFKSPDKDMDKIKIPDAVILGITQAIGIIPGISRCGITISTLLARGFDTQSAFKFSFLTAIPAIVGATILELKDFQGMIDKASLIAGFIASFIMGLFSLIVLRRIMLKGKLYYFGYYCILAAIIMAIFVKS